MTIEANYPSGSEDIVEPDPYEVDERVQSTLLPSGDDLELIMRYGSMLHRQWIQIHNQLITVQARRRGEKVPVAMVDIMGPPPNLGPFRSSPSPVTELVQTAEARITQAERGLAERRRTPRAEAS